MYAGYIATQFGFLLANPTAWNLAIYATSWLIQVGRIIAEERMLIRDRDYQDFAARVPYRLIPGIF
jgi:protein-S-isoprenylcysteine O-methyltransferase Ste14